MDQYILALDQGTTSSRAILFDRAGHIKGSRQQEFTQYFPQPGWVEHDPLEIRDSQFGVARDLLKQTGVQASQVAAIGIANQRETTIVWDRKSGEPVYPAIVWQDRRTAAHCEQLLASGMGKVFEERTGLIVDPYFSGTKLAWILDHVPNARKRAECGELAFGTVDAWLAWQMTGRHVTDVSNASRTLLFNISSLDWDPDLLELLRIPRALLPELVPTSGVLGKSREDVFGTAIPIASVVGDQQAACFGQLCLRPGMAKNTYGTGCFLLLNAGTEARAAKGLLRSLAWQYESQGVSRRAQVVEGSVFSAGATIQWLRDGLGIIKNAAEVEALARSVPDSGGVMMVPAFTGLGAPHWDAQARGTILGMTRGSTAAHIARAAVECIAFQVAELLRTMQSESIFPLLELRVDGGAARNDLLMQFQADLLGIPVLRPQITETTAMGAAFLAGLAVGFWRDEEELEQLWREEKRFQPAMSSDQRETLLGRWSTAVLATRQFKT